LAAKDPPCAYDIDMCRWAPSAANEPAHEYLQVAMHLGRLFRPSHAQLSHAQAADALQHEGGAGAMAVQRRFERGAQVVAGTQA
jgi:hypothetical protein